MITKEDIVQWTRDDYTRYHCRTTEEKDYVVNFLGGEIVGTCLKNRRIIWWDIEVRKEHTSEKD